MSDKKKLSLNKPPVPARPKNLVVYNSKHLPKPPETSEKITNFIRDLNLDIKESMPDEATKKLKNSDQENHRNTLSSDGEEDTYGYLEPVALPAFDSSDATSVKKTLNSNFATKKYQDETCKLGEIFQKLLKNNSKSGETEEAKPQIMHNQWQRPLPLPPVNTKSEIAKFPWFKDIDRKRGEEILKNGIDGYFLVRPSSNSNAYLTLTLWFNNRVYNIPIRQRKDKKFALGTPKTNEQSFDTIEYMIKNYQSEKLVLFSNGVESGKTLLTTFPP